MRRTPRSTLNDPQQIIADLKRQLAEREAELAEAREQQTATAEVLGVINSSPGDLAPVFEAMLDRALQLCDAAYGVLNAFDDEQMRTVSARGEARIVDWLMAREPRRPGPGTTMDRIVRGEDVVQIADVTDDAVYRDGHPFRRALVEIGGCRTALSLALRKDERLLGAVIVYRQEVRPFTDKQIALLQNFAAQAVIAMENARLITETREALEQQTATAEVLGVINSSPGDLVPVFDAMLAKATRLCEAQTGHLLRYENGAFRRTASLGIPEEFDRLLPLDAPMSDAITRDSVVVRMLATRSVIHVHDLREDESYRAGAPAEVAAVDKAGIRSALFVPLLKEGEVVGAFLMHRLEVRPFSDQQIALLQNFAAQAVIAMENARLITETREALEQQTATAEVLQLINASPGDLAPVFDTMLEKALRLCEAAFGILSTYDGEFFRTAALRGVPAELAEVNREPFRAGRGYATARLAAGESVVHVADITQRERTPGTQAMAELAGARTVIWVALCKDDALLGFFTIYRQEVRPFSDKQIALLENFAAQAVIAMENARLITETREALEQQTATAEVLGVINSSPGDLAPVFDAMLERALRLCQAAFGFLWTWDGEQMHRCAFQGIRAELMQDLRQPLKPPAGSIPERIVGGERVVIEVDAALRSPMLAGLGARSCVGAALRTDDKLLGGITIYRQEVRPFTDKEIALLENFAAQAVIAMENARLITETREALEQQTATAEVLGVINSSPGDLAPVFDAILEKAHALCGASTGSLQLYDGEFIRAVASRGLPDEFANELRKPRRSAFRDASLRDAPFVQITDIADPVLTGGDTTFLTAHGVTGVRTHLRVPLRKDDALFGFIVAGRREVRPFSQQEISLIQNFAAQAVIAMENARLLTETREALDQQTATAEVLQVINSSPGDLAPVFDAMLEKAMRLCEAAFGALRTYDGNSFRAVATHGVPEPFAEFYAHNPPSYGPGTGPARILSGEPFVHVADLASEEAYLEGEPSRRALVELGGARTSLTVPLRKDDALLGFIMIYRQEVRPFTDKQIALLQNFATQAVIAMENARLLGELRQRTDEVAELNRGLEARVAEQVDELGRVGRLKRFLAPQLAELIVSQGDEKILESHRREIVVVFCDLRGYTAFTETAEPEEVLEFLRQYHGALGPLVSQFEGTLDQFSGDGIMVFFNDPVPCPDPAERAVKMAMAMREAARELIAAWSRHGCELGFGAGIAQGFATLGQIGFSERSGYTAIGTVCNLAARLCAEAKDGQILVSSRIAEAVEAVARLEDLGNLELKGLRRPVAAFNVAQSTSPAEARPNLTVVARDPGA